VETASVQQVPERRATIIKWGPLSSVRWNGSSFDTLPLLFDDIQIQPPLPPGSFLERGAFAPFDMPPVQWEK